MRTRIKTVSLFLLLLSFTVTSFSDVQPKQGAIITARVVDQKGNPLAGVKLQTDQRQHAETDANGIFQFVGLTPRKYYIDADANKLPLVMPQFTATITKEGQIKKLPDIVMTPGALVVGKITMAKTGEPIAGAKVSSSGTNESEVIIRLITVRTNADGKYQLRLPPVKTTVFASNTSEKYFEQSYFQSVDLKEGQTITQNFEFDPGVTLSGTAVDNQGQPAKNVPVIVDALPMKSDYKLLPRKTVTDSNGNWSISGIAPRKVQVRVGDSWATDKLITFNLPHPAKVLLHLIPQNDLPPVGRLIDTNGKPVAGIKATLQYEMPHPSPFDIKTNTVLRSDKNGYLHFRMPLVASLPTISGVDVNGYQWTNGGDWDDKTRRFSDVNLDPLTRRINGRVVDGNGKLVAGARVLAVGLGKDETITNPKGEFFFAALPDHQQLTLLAIGNTGVAKLLLDDSQKTATLRLSPIHQHFPSRAQSLDALELLYNSSADETERNSIIDDMAQYDVPRALKTIQGNQQVFPASQIPQTLNLIATNNPQMALQWGGEQLPRITAKDRIAMLCSLTKLAVKQNKTLAQKYFHQAIELAEAIPEPKEKIDQGKESTDTQTLSFLESRIQLAGAAAKVQPAQTRKWVDEILPFFKDNGNWPRANLVTELAVSAPQEAARVIDSSAANIKIDEYQYAIQAAVKSKNSKLAMHWLTQFQSFIPSLDERSSAYFPLQEVAIATINLIGSNDPKLALQIARSTDSANALILAAQFQPRETALKIWREEYNSGSILDDARLVGLIYDADETEGKVLFDELVKTYWKQLNTDNMMRRSASDIAYYLARYKPRESWLMLQTEWIQSLENPSRRTSDQANLALAMSGVDFEEAIHWARQIESQDKELSRKTQRQLWEIALATPPQRRNLSVLGFYLSDSYKPGDAAVWQ